MFWNNLKVAYRNLLRHPLYAAINVVGLSIAISFCLLAFIFVRFEWTYDAFHENADRIYRIYLDKEQSFRVHPQFTPEAMAPALTAELPEIQTVRIAPRGKMVQTRSQKGEATVHFADPAILKVFSFPLLRGDAATALNDPYSVVISENAAGRFFPGEDPIGRTLTVQDFKQGLFRALAARKRQRGRFQGTASNETDDTRIREFTVTGLFKPIPGNSSIKLDFLSNFDAAGIDGGWKTSSVNSYMLLPNHLAPSEVERRLSKLASSWPDDQRHGKWKLQPLRDIYFGLEAQVIRSEGNPAYSYILASIAIIVIVVAAVNYTSLSVGQSFSRVREVGIRKVAGGLRTQLARQFLAESVLLTVISLTLGLGLAELFLPGFNSLVNREFSLSNLADFSSLVSVLVVVLFVGIVAGGFPALFMSGFLPVDALKGRFKVDRTRFFSRALVVFQLAISTSLVTGMTIASIQMNMLKSRSLGFEAGNVIVVRMMEVLERRESVKSFEEATWPYHSVLKTTRTSHALSNSRRSFSKIRWKGTTLDGVEKIRCDRRFLETLDIGLLEGRDFERKSDAETSVIVNQSLARKLGWEAPLDETLRFDRNQRTVIGVVGDFHFRSLHHAIGPAVLQFQADSTSSGMEWVFRNLLMIRIRPENVSDTLDFLSERWREVFPDKPFDYYFLDEDIDRQYREEERWFRIAGFATFFAVFIACLGAFGLTSLTVARRTKEIGIRKTLGAPTSRIVSLLTREYVVLVGIAALIAWPATYFAAERWLRDFAYRVDPGLGTFLLGGALMLLMVLLAVSLQVTRAARANPVDALRYE
ncbi:MAG: ABC transporter permease [Gemmatimonadota bacterium]|nr:ABC transporter permease [Gemmatimonadota bacterium]